MFDLILGTPLGFQIGMFFVLGLLLGSFANVVIFRLPEGKSVVAPSSRCPKCSTPIRWFDNLPVLSWLALRGKCRSCKTPISWRYPVVELLMGSLFAVTFWHIDWNWFLLEALIFVFGLVVVTFIDFDHMILPDEFTLSGIVLGLLGGWLNPDRDLMSAFLGFLMGGGFLWAIAYVYETLRKEEGMGGGDIKLLAWIGAVLGWQSIPFVILSSSVIGSVVGLAVMARTKGGLKSTIPFGPYLALGAILYMLGGQAFGDWYLSLFVPALQPY